MYSEAKSNAQSILPNQAVATRWRMLLLALILLGCFSGALAAAPDPPATPSPADTATSVSILTDLDWADSDYATTYGVYLSQDTTFMQYGGKNSLGAASQPYSVFLADREGDGDLDVLYTIFLNQDVGWFIND
ncbi:hypothetical protein HQ520_14675, partial [bacterium]|nr:hypothetical protein [bacterium]